MRIGFWVLISIIGQLIDWSFRYLPCLRTDNDWFIKVKVASVQAPL